MPSESSAIHPAAVVLKSRLGCCVEVAERTQIVESVLGDYTYVMNDGDVIYSHIGKFCSIASHVRINPGNIGRDDRVRAVVDSCRDRGIPIRIGVMSGSVMAP